MIGPMPLAIRSCRQPLTRKTCTCGTPAIDRPTLTWALPRGEKTATTADGIPLGFGATHVVSVRGRVRSRPRAVGVLASRLRGR